jgi:predicted DNA-binding transcriptional regulator AlpA
MKPFKNLGLWIFRDRGTMDLTMAMKRLDENRLWKVNDLAKYIGVSPRTVYRLRKVGKCPPSYKLVKALRWMPSVVKKWIKEESGKEG